MVARRRQIESEVQACENELGTLTVQPAWRCVHQANITSRGTLVVFCVRVIALYEELDVRVSVFMPQIITSKDDALESVYPHRDIIIRALEPTMTLKAKTDRLTMSVCVALYGDGTGTDPDSLYIEHVVPVNVGPESEPRVCYVIDYCIDGSF